MKRYICALVLVLSLGFIVGCGNKEEDFSNKPLTPIGKPNPDTPTAPMGGGAPSAPAGGAKAGTGAVGN